MKKDAFIDYIKSADFRNLFINELGWNKCEDSFLPIEVDGKEYQFYSEAELCGLHVLSCSVDDMPTNTLCKKIDYKLRKFANDYIAIFKAPGEMHHLWAVPVRTVDKRDMVTLEYKEPRQTDFLFSKIPDLTFQYGVHLTIVDVKAMVQKAFEVNSGEITKKFYTEFKKQHKVFNEFITGIQNIDDCKWYTSIMLNRLMFCYFIQKKNFLDNNPDYLFGKLREVKRLKGENAFFKSFYKGFLCRLFHDGLNNPDHSDEFEDIYGNIPYLNGGMFDVHELEEKYPDIDIDDAAFEKIFMFFDEWRWHLDTRIEATGKDINPDVLGYIFEQYINDRAQMGAYYTKEDITGYIGRNCIVPFLMDETAKKSPADFKPDGYVWQYLKSHIDDSGLSPYIYDAVKKGYGLDIPADIAQGLDTSKPNLLERRSHWNEKTPTEFALPTEIWRETIERLKHCGEVNDKIKNGEVTQINDFITYNLDICQFVQDILKDTSDHTFILHFYAALQKVTILDPTCGSGAFLFAAMNILEPLYEICIDRMTDFHNANDNLFKEQLLEINSKYHNNIPYFIFKSIILRNLYGVDIMPEAVEIAKLRLFLKMMSVATVDANADNMGIEPLPDIDFNIRCGNTLVGYATEQELDNDLNFGDMFSKADYKAKIENKMDIVAKTFERFKQLQLAEHKLGDFNKAKHDLKDELKELNLMLNQKLYASTITDKKISYEQWLKDYQPFHWLAEFYQIIQGNGGFDVIIGNPPYVVYTKKDKTTNKSVSDKYELKGYKTLETNNLYSFVIERSFNILRNKDCIGMIIPISLTFSSDFKSLRKLIMDKSIWISSYDNIPASIFEGVSQRCSILMMRSDNKNLLEVTRMYRWKSIYRKYLINALSYCIIEKEYSFYINIPKAINQTTFAILNKISKKNYQQSTLLFHNIGYSPTARNYISSYVSEPPCIDCQSLLPCSPSQKSIIRVFSEKDQFVGFICLCGDLSFLYWLIYGDGFHVTNYNMLPIIGCALSIDIKYKLLLIELGKFLNIRRNECLVFKKNAGKYVGSYCYRNIKGITRRSDLLLMAGIGISKNEALSIFNWSDIILSINENAGEKSIPEIVKEKYPPNKYDEKEQCALFDEIDNVLIKYYGFTKTDLNVIFNDNKAKSEVQSNYE